MKTMIKAGAAILTAALFVGCDTDPVRPCAVGHGGYGAELVYVSGDNSGSCFRQGDIIGVQKYRQEDGNPEIYLKPESISQEDWVVGAFITGDMPTGDQYTSLGHGTLSASEPDADGFCTAPTMTAGSGITWAGEELTYQFSNVKFFNGPGTPGTQFTADLVISGTDRDTGTDCSTTYRVNAMYPVIFCNNLDDTSPDFGGANEEACDNVDEVWSGVAASPFFASKCNAYGNPDTAGEADWLITGDMPWLICVPDGEIPALVQ